MYIPGTYGGIYAIQTTETTIRKTDCPKIQCPNELKSQI